MKIGNNFEKRVRKVVDLAYKVQFMPIVNPDTEEVSSFMNVGCKLSDYLDIGISPEKYEEFDVDVDTIDNLFKVTHVGKVKFTVVNMVEISTIDENIVISYIFNLGNLIKLLEHIAEPYGVEIVSDSTDAMVNGSNSKDVAVIDGSDKSIGGELVNNEGYEETYMDSWLMSEVMNIAGGNPMITMELMKKKSEGKLTNDVMQKIIYSCPTGFRSGPAATMMLMQILQKIK